jgi:mycothiol synthase
VTTTEIAARHYAGEGDLAPIADFLNLCEAHDQVEEGTSAEELRVEFAEPGFDVARDVLLLEGADGQLVGFGQLWVPEQIEENDGFLWFKAHPELRGGEIEQRLIDWAEGQLRERGRTKLRLVARDKETERVALFEQLGFAPARYFLRMVRSLDEPIAEPVFPAGYTLRDGDHDPQAWADMYNESFVDHYNFHHHTADEIRHWQQEPEYRSELNLAAVAADGTLAAFAWCGIRPGENERSGRKDGWVGLLGTRRGHRGKGLGRAMLLAGMRRIKEAGMEYAKLGVDADSPTGATRLYESVGFRTAYSRTLFSRDVSR